MEGASVGTVRNMPVPPAAGSDAHAMQMLQLAMAAEEQNSELRARLADKDAQLEKLQLQIGQLGAAPGLLGEGALPSILGDGALPSIFGDGALPSIEALQLQVDSMRAEKKEMTKHVTEMVDERAALRAGWVQLETERRDFASERQQAAASIAYAAQLEQSEHTVRKHADELQAELLLYTTKCTELTEAYLELEQTLDEKQQRINLMIRENAQSEMQIILLQNKFDLADQRPEMLEKLRENLRGQMEGGGSSTVEAMTLRHELEAIQHENYELSCSSARLTEQASVHNSTMGALRSQITEAERKLADARADADKLRAELDISVGKEMHKGGLNDRLLADGTKTEFKIRVLRQELDSAEVEKAEALAKLAEQVCVAPLLHRFEMKGQVHITTELNFERQRLLNHIAERMD